MTTTRPYRKALDVREALTRLADAAGTQLDEQLVGTFIQGIEHEPDAPAAGPRDRLAPGCGRPAAGSPEARSMRTGAWRSASAVAIALGLLLASAGTVLAGRAWTIDASPSSLDENDAGPVTLDVRNTGGDGGGDEIGCVVVTIPAEFKIDGASVSSVKGASPGHGWVAVVSGSKVAFMEPDDSNVLVGIARGR